ncbi:MAG: LacI family DNA-binding transcriptional regulator [Eggerthellaceae bacterium]|nr:LacI family DNA-binding transcriptional regulator [Eggerthellaceae bacterium]
MARITIGDVAREAGVSLGTVSNAFNHPDKVRPDTLEVINEAIAKLGYVPNQAARQLAGSESRVLGLVLPRLDHAFSLQIAHGVQTESLEHGYDLLIASAGNDDILESQYMRYFLGAHVAGVLVQPMASTSWDPPVEATPIPVVYLDVHGRSLSNYVAADNEAQGRLILGHAASCGAQRVTVIGKAEFMQLTLRVYGIREGSAATGLKVEFLNIGNWNSAEDGFNIGRKLALREKSERPDFVIGLTDVLATGAIDGILSAGLSVPDNMLVAGCDGNPLAWHGSIPLTTIESPGFEIGRQGARLLLSQIAGEDPSNQNAHGHLIAPHLISRMSTAASPDARKRATIPELNLAEYL